MPHGKVLNLGSLEAGYREQALPVSRILRVMSSVRWQLLQEGWLGLRTAREAGTRVYVVAQDVHVPLPIAALTRTAFPPPDAACSVGMSVQKVGRSSFRLRVVMELAGLQTVCSVVYVCVDAGTGRSIEIPSEVREALEAELGSEEEEEEEETVLPPPPKGPDMDGAAVLHVRVRPSDTDWNGHLNQSQYVSFLEDAVEESTGRHPLFLRVSISYLKEVKSGEELVVSWKPSGTSRGGGSGIAFHFVSLTQGDVVVARGAALRSDG